MVRVNVGTWVKLQTVTGFNLTYCVMNLGVEEICNSENWLWMVVLWSVVEGMRFAVPRNSEDDSCLMMSNCRKCLETGLASLEADTVRKEFSSIYVCHV